MSRSEDRERARNYYLFHDLVRLGYCDDRNDLSEKIRFHGFPRPEKRGPYLSSRAEYPCDQVHAWDDARNKEEHAA